MPTANWSWSWCRHWSPYIKFLGICEQYLNFRELGSSGRTCNHPGLVQYRYTFMQGHEGLLISYAYFESLLIVMQIREKNQNAAPRFAELYVCLIFWEIRWGFLRKKRSALL